MILSVVTCLAGMQVLSTGRYPGESTRFMLDILRHSIAELQLNALRWGINVEYNQKQQTCQGCFETLLLGISCDLHATADLAACSAYKRAGCRDVKWVSHGQSSHFILYHMSLKLGCRGLCDCSLFRYDLGLRNLQLIWCKADQAGSSQTWHQRMMNWRLWIQAKIARSYYHGPSRSISFDPVKQILKKDWNLWNQIQQHYHQIHPSSSSSSSSRSTNDSPNICFLSVKTCMFAPTTQNYAVSEHRSMPNLKNVSQLSRMICTSFQFGKCHYMPVSLPIWSGISQPTTHVRIQ